MAVGGQASSGTVDQQLTDLAVSLRNNMQKIANLFRWITGQGDGQAKLVAMGYSAGDAAAVLQQVSYLNTVAALYYGTASQTPAFDFHNELSQLWAGQ